MKIKNPYRNFSNYVLRTPLFPFTFFIELTSKKQILIEDYKKLWDNPIIKEAIFLASPNLTDDIDKWLEYGLKDKKKEDKLKYTFLKYVSRMSSRCTPFGLFAGFSLGKFEDQTQIKLKNSNKRHTRLDMNYLVALSQDLVKDKNIKKQLLFYPNSSIYEVGDRLRYVEYRYINGRRFHQISEVDSTEYLRNLLSYATKGMLLSDLSSSLLMYDITTKEASDFINELVGSQLIISELEPSVSGPEFFNQICSVLKKLKGTEKIISILNKVNNEILDLDNTIGNNKQKYIEISELLKELQTDFDIKYLFQTDMVIDTEINTLDKEIISDLKKGLAFLSRLNIDSNETPLKKFKEAFSERYEDKEVKLSTALDVELGIGYLQNNGKGDISPLIDNLVFTPNNSKKGTREIKWSPIYNEFQKRLKQAAKDDAYIISFTDEDFKEFEVDLENFPDTISTMIEVIKENKTLKIRFNGGGGSSSANLLGRFCHSDELLNAYTNEMINIEAKINKDKILAEIVHLPESRVGNILMRPDFRSYEIPYLAKSIKAEERKLSLDDLMISKKNNGEILLRSMKHNKEVLPRLTTAHNYSSNSLPIYHFLADMQTQGVKSSLGIYLGPFAEEYEFVPRIEYNRLILRDATWNLNSKHIKPLLKEMSNDDSLIKSVNIFREKLRIPEFVMLTDGDNELLVNFKNITSTKMFLSAVKNRSRIKLTEFLFNDNGIVNSKDGAFTNQVIVSFYNEEKLNQREKDNNNNNK